MAKTLEGKYRAKVLPFTFEKVGEKESPMMKGNFQPIGQVVDNAVVAEADLPKQNYGYFLDLSIQDKGKYAGKSGLEAVRLQMEEVYGYTGPFDMEAINKHVEGREVDIVCEKTEKNGRVFTKVKYVNAVGGSGQGRKPVKHLAPEEVAAFAKHWGGGATAATPKDSKSLFASLVGGDKSA